jgi:Ca2+/Na+ antiporter
MNIIDMNVKDIVIILLVVFVFALIRKLYFTKRINISHDAAIILVLTLTGIFYFYLKSKYYKRKENEKRKRKQNA